MYRVLNSSASFDPHQPKHTIHPLVFLEVPVIHNFPYTNNPDLLGLPFFTNYTSIYVLGTLLLSMVTVFFEYHLLLIDLPDSIPSRAGISASVWDRYQPTIVRHLGSYLFVAVILV